MPELTDIIDAGEVLGNVDGSADGVNIADVATATLAVTVPDVAADGTISEGV